MKLTVENLGKFKGNEFGLFMNGKIEFIVSHSSWGVCTDKLNPKWIDYGTFISTLDPTFNWQFFDSDRIKMPHTKPTFIENLRKWWFYYKPFRYSATKCISFTVRYISILYVFQVMWGGDIVWFRIFGYGLKIADRIANPPLFSERNGITKSLRIGKWSIGTLKPDGI